MPLLDPPGRQFVRQARLPHVAPQGVPHGSRGRATGRASKVEVEVEGSQ
jgi:hypothetical protein